MTNQRAAVIGSGPAGLMAAWVLSGAGIDVTLFEKRRGTGRKLLIAGSSGLNISYDCPLDEFVRHYAGPHERMRAALEAFPPGAWLRFIEDELGIRTFKGTSRRYFVEGMKAAALLRAWMDALERRGVRVEQGRECVGFGPEDGGVRLEFSDGPAFQADAACFCLGGGSYELREEPLRWPEIFRRHGLAIREFAPSNAGFRVDWPAALLAEAEGKPIKNVVLSSSRGQRSGDLVITGYGIEGTPVYFAGESGVVHLDLKPDLTPERLWSKLTLTRENLSPIRRVKRFLNLGEGAMALVFHLTPPERLARLESLAADLKRFPLRLVEPRPLAESISSSGGLEWGELDEGLRLRRFPRVCAAGEMLDWDAPTGGFLIQACVSQGYLAGRAMAARLKQESS